MAAQDVNVNALTQVNAPASIDSIVMVDRNTNEGKIIDANTYKNLLGTLIVTCSSVSSLPFTPPDSTANLSKVTSDMVVVNAVLSNSKAMNSDWTVATSDATLTISGTIVSGQTTNVTLYLQHQRT